MLLTEPYCYNLEMLELHSQLLKSGSFLEMLGGLEAVRFTRMHKKDGKLLSNYKKWFEGKFKHENHHLLLKNSSESEAKTEKRDSAFWTAMYNLAF